MKNFLNSHSAFFGLCIITLSVSGCESNSVNGYFSGMPASSSANSQGTEGTSPVTNPTSNPTMIPTSAPTLVPTSTPTTIITPAPVPTVTATATPLPPPKPTPVPTVGPTTGPTSTPTSVPTVVPTSTPTSVPTTVPTVTPTPVSIPPTTPTPTPAPTQTPVALPSSFVPNGILNGHFDVDTATTTMPFPVANGNVTYHVHEYDKLNETTTVDFFNLINDGGLKEAGSSFDQIQKAIPKTKRFYLVVVNPNLNPGGVLELNGSVLRVTDYQNVNQHLLASGVGPSAYTIGAPATAGDVQLKSLKIAFDSTVTADELLVPTGPTACVFPNIEGKLGEYRDGALVVQAIDASAIELNASTGAALPNGGLLWEGIIYNHYMTVDQHGNEVDPEICY